MFPLAVALLAADAGAARLAELYDQTLASHPVLRGKEYAIDQATAEKDQVLAKLLPQIMATGNLSWNELRQAVVVGGRSLGTDTQGYQGSRGIIQARQALFDLPSFLRLQGARASIHQTEQDLQSARMGIAADLIDRYFQALLAGDEIGYVQGEQELTSSELKRIRKMRERQLAPITDLYEVEAYYQSLQTRELEARNARAAALEKLREMTGTEVPEVAPLRTDDLPPVPGDADQWVNDAIRRHPTLLGFQYAEEAARKTIAATRAEHLPQLGLQLSETYADNGGFDNRQLPRYTVATVGLQLNVPIYSGGGIEAAARGATAEYHIVLEKKTEKRREIEKETRTAWLDAQTGRSRIDSTAREADARAKARDAQVRSYQLGVSTISALLESKKNLLKAQVEHSKARYDYIRALVALRLWAGDLSQRDVEDIDSWLAADGSPQALPPATESAGTREAVE
jgi:outer membrane protein